MPRNLVNRLRQSFLQLNLYKRALSTEETTEKELLATRLYVCSLSLTILIIAITSAFLVRTVNKIEYSPSHTRFSHLISTYSHTLHCPCSTIGIPYHKFVTTHVHFHQVCSSLFIQQTFIDRIFSHYNTSSLSPDDFRLTLAFFWQLIRGFCMTSSTTWNATLTAFESSHIFNPEAIAAKILRSQIKTTLQQQIDSAQTKLAYNLFSIRRLTSGNQFVSALATNYYLRYPPHDSDAKPSPKMSPRTYNNCSCLSVEGCPNSAMINDSHGHSIAIPGLIGDCLVIDGTLASTLECYYNQTCLTLLHHPFLPSSIQPLSNKSNKHFLVNFTIEVLLNELMIDEMVNEIRFDVYYSSCNVSYCSYSYDDRFDVLFIITTIIGIYGGLSFVLRFISPYIAIIILKWKNRHAPNSNVLHTTTVNQQDKLQILVNHLRSLANHIRRTIDNLNLFEQQIPRTGINVHREQLLTRVFIVFLLISCVTAGFYTFLFVQNQTVTIPKPSFDAYQQLYNNYSDTLQCPCTNMSVSYGDFLNVTFILHQVCSSDFIAPTWLNYLILFDPIFLPSRTVSRQARDFRTIGASYFQLLSIFCSLAKNNIGYANRLFSSNQFINTNVPTPSSFYQQTQSMIKLYISNTRNDFKHTFDWIYISVIINYLLTGTNSNFHITVTDNNTLIINELQFDVVFDITTHGSISAVNTCVCPTESLSCKSINLLYINGSSMYQFEQFFRELPIGCIPLTGFLKSTFQWWYNETYIKNIQATYSVVIHSQPMVNIKSLNTSIATRFDNNNLEYLIKEMFMETLINHTDFHRFYNACAPLSCSYSVTQRRNIIVALLLFISISGGLHEILLLLIPAIGKLIFFFMDCWNSRGSQYGTPSTRVRFNQFFNVIYQSTIKMNLYETGSTDDIVIKQQRMYTRTYLLLFITSLSIILFYTAIVQRSITQTHALSSINDYENLLEAHSDDLNCPCTRIAIPYNDLLTELQVNRFHQACSTNVIDMALMAGNFDHFGTRYSNEKDFRNFRYIFIEGLKQLCILARESINNSITIFRHSTVFFNQLISLDQFYSEMNMTINQFKQKISTEFARTLDLIRTNTQGNALIGVFSTNWKFVVDEKNQGRNTSFHSQPVTYFNSEENTSCSCATSQSCIMPAQIFHSNGTVSYISEGLRLGCNLLETTLLSSLSCFYSTKCVEEFRNKLYLSPYDRDSITNEIVSTMQLNRSLTRFNINDTIERLAYEMFIESWITGMSYERFFNSCSPTYCAYKIYYRFDGVEVLTTFLSVYVGLSIGIHIIVPYFIQTIKKIYNRVRVTPLS